MYPTLSSIRKQTAIPTQPKNAVLTLGQIRRLLDDVRDPDAHAEAIHAILPRLWHRSVLERYEAARILTTRIYLPPTLFFIEWGSFPAVFPRALRARFPVMPENAEERRQAVGETLCQLLQSWLANFDKQIMRKTKDFAVSTPPNQDFGADLCEACGRLGIYEAESFLLTMLDNFQLSNNQVRVSALVALAMLPPEKLTQLWEGLRAPRRIRYAAAFSYMTLPAAVPFLLETLTHQEAQHGDVARPLLLALGTIGDPRALPVLNAIARDDRNALQPTAKRAISILMKEAQGMEEVTLVRASDPSSLNGDILLRASDGREIETPADQLLRSSDAIISEPATTARNQSGPPTAPEPRQRETTHGATGGEN